MGNAILGDSLSFLKRVIERYGSLEAYRIAATSKPKRPGPWRKKKKTKLNPPRPRKRKSRKKRKAAGIKVTPLTKKKKRRSRKKTHKEKYYEYLQSDKWHALREEVMERDNYKCQSCGSSRNLQAHHLTYDLIFNERLSDLITLCRDCHKKKHNTQGDPDGRPKNDLT